MEISGLGGGLMFAAAAGLWLVYLMPTWFKRREYLATERNAVRLQQTLRVLAETSEVPTVVRAETSGRSIAAHERALRQQQEQADAVARARDTHALRLEAANRSALSADARAARISADTNAAAAALAAGAAGADAIAAAEAIADLPAGLLTPAQQAARRLRRTRAAATLLSFTALIVIIVQVIALFVSGFTASAGPVLGFALIAIVTGVAALVRLAAVARRREAPAVSVQRVQRTRTSTPIPDFAVAPVAEEPAEWTPVPLPKPLYLSRDEVLARAGVTPVFQQPGVLLAEEQKRLRAAAAAQANEELRVAAEAAASNLRQAQAAAEVIPIVATQPQAPAVPSRFAGMGIMEPADATRPDINAAMRRRRQAS
ncbi:MAG TPA: hypothetical protein VGP24_12960 [Glaciihabitans sp.]|jgi:hypothetical protein|nr:hypothetical protein [Glaciihabitans sp.]